VLVYTCTYLQIYTCICYFQLIGRNWNDVPARAWAIFVRIQRLEVCCSVLPCVGGCCSVLRQQYRRECPLQCVAVCGSVLQCTAVHCSALQCVASECPLHYKWRSFRDFWMQICNDKARGLNSKSHYYCARYDSVLQCVAVCCSALQCVAVHCSALQCIAVHRSAS